MGTEDTIACLKHLAQRCGTSQFIPDVVTIEHLFKQKETTEEAQSSGKITAWDTFIGIQQSN